MLRATAIHVHVVLDCSLLQCMHVHVQAPIYGTCIRVHVHVDGVYMHLAEVLLNNLHIIKNVNNMHVHVQDVHVHAHIMFLTFQRGNCLILFFALAPSELY